jgi:hypothetical protein
MRAASLQRSVWLKEAAFSFQMSGGNVTNKKWVAPLIGVIAAGWVETAGMGTVSAVAAPVASGVAEEVTIERVRLALGGVKVEAAGVGGTVDWVSEESLVVEADLSKQPATARILFDLPAGTYKGIEISIDKLERGKHAEELLLAQHPTMAEASVAIDGRVVRNSLEESFAFTAALDHDIKIRFKPALAVSGPAGGVPVTLVLAMARWFLDKEGNRLDPRDPANRSNIEENIQKSFKAFVDRGESPGPITGVAIDRLRLVLGGVKLEKAGVDGTEDWVSEDSLVVEADLRGDPVTAYILIEAPAGTYKGIEISIDKLERGKRGEDLLLAQHPTMADASVAIDGRLLGSGPDVSFAFTAALDLDVKIDFKEPPFLVVGSPGVPVTLVLGRERWFLDKEGQRLDPRDPAHRSDIEANIKASFKGFLVGGPGQ